MIKEQFADFHPEDKVVLWRVGNDRPHITIVYVHKHGKGGNEHM